MKRSPVGAFAGAIISLAIALMGALNTIGQTARLVQVLTILFGGAATGASLVKALEIMRTSKKKEGESSLKM